MNQTSFIQNSNAIYHHERAGGRSGGNACVRVEVSECEHTTLQHCVSCHYLLLEMNESQLV